MLPSRFAKVLACCLIYISGLPILARAQSLPDFSIAVTPSSQSVTAGQSVQFQVTLTSASALSVTLSCSDLPSGSSCNFSPNPASPGTYNFTVNTASSAPTGTVSFTVKGTSGPLVKTATASLTISSGSNPPPSATPDFSLSISPSSQTVNAGNSTTYTVSINPSGGFNSSVSLSCTGVPSGASCSFSQNPTISSSTLIVLTNNNASSGIITVSGTSGILTHSVTTKLVVSTTQAQTPVLQVSHTSMAFSATEGGNSPASQSFSISNGGSGTLSWTATKGQPWLTLGPSSGNAPASVSVSVNISGLTAGNYNDAITITASGAQASPQTISATLTVNSPLGTPTPVQTTFTSFSYVNGATAQVHDLAVGPDGSVYVLFPLQPGTSLGVAKSTDKGNSFPTAVAIPSSAYSNFEYDLFVDPSNVIHVVWWRSRSSTETYYSQSRDGSATFSTPISVRTGLTYNGYRTESAIEPVISADGQGNVYVAYSGYTVNSSGMFLGYNIWISKSTNGGLSFQPEVFLNVPATGQRRPTRIAVTGERLYLLYVNELTNDLFVHRRSTDLVFANDSTRINVMPGTALYGGSDLAASPDGNTLFVVYADTSTDSEGNINFCKSNDGGASWGSCTTVNDNTYRSQYQPSLVLDGFGSLHVVWTDLRSNSKYQTYYANSYDGGTTFSANINISSDQSTTDFTQPHIVFDSLSSSLYVSSSKNYAQVVISSKTVTSGSTGGNPSPSQTSISPSSVAAGGADFTLTVSGTNFGAGSIVRWNGSDRTTTFVNSGQVSAAILASDISVIGTVQISVFNPPPGGGTSNALTFTITAANAVPSLTTISPSNGAAGAQGFTLTVDGTNFVSGSTVLWNGSIRTTTFVRSTQLTAVIAATDISVTGSVQVTVFNPPPGGGTSNALTFTITVTNPTPSINTLAPSSAAAGGAAFTLTVNGADFVAGSIVRWNGHDRTTTFVNSGQLSAGILATDIAAVGTAQVTVFNPQPGGGISNASTFAISMFANPQINSGGIVNAASFAANAAVAPGSIASVFGSSFISGGGSASTTVRVDGVQAFLFDAVPQQMNFQVPWELSGRSQGTVVITSGGKSSSPATVNLTPYAPGIFATNASGIGQGAILIADGASLAGPLGTYPGSRPANPGEFISIYCTGLGPVNNQPPSGTKAPANPLSTTLLPPTVNIGGVAAQVVFSGLSPGFIGLYQVNVRVPMNAPPGGSSCIDDGRCVLEHCYNRHFQNSSSIFIICRGRSWYSWRWNLSQPQSISFRRITDTIPLKNCGRRSITYLVSSTRSDDSTHCQNWQSTKIRSVCGELWYRTHEHRTYENYVQWGGWFVV